MLTSLTAVTAACLISALIGLLLIGGRWKQARLDLLLAYAFLVGLPVYLFGEHVWRLPHSYLWLGLAVTGFFVLAVGVVRRDWNPPSQVFFGTLFAASGLFLIFAMRFSFWSGLSPIGMAGSFLLVLLELFAFALLVISTHEVLNVAGRVRWRRRTHGVESKGPQPFVSIHVATHNEPPELVLATLQSLRALDYDNYEVIVLDNNTDDPALWQPLEHFCGLNDFRFVHLENWPGFKSGALNYGLKITDERAEVIAIVDADFVVEPDFLSSTVGYFESPKVGIVQTTQAFVTDDNVPYLRRLALTYRTFDEVTMPSRNEHDAIIFAGTMGLLRRSALEEAGGWAEWCVTEDAELSLRILGRGYESIYVEKSFGRGVMPLTFAALKRQRFRWCFGGIQVLRRHWRLMVTGRGHDADGTKLRLTGAQRYEYLAGSLQWFHALLTIVFTLFLTLAASARVASIDLQIRPLVGIFVLVPLLLLVSGVAKAIWGLRARLKVTTSDAIWVMGVWLALTWAVALGCIQSLSGRQMPFFRTPKFKDRESLKQTLLSTRAETPVALFLTITGVALIVTQPPTAQTVFIVALTLWSGLVFWCAPAVAFAATRADLSGTLRKRRYLESIRGRTSYRRPLAVGLATGAAALAFVTFVGGSTSVGPEPPSFGQQFALPERAQGRESSETNDIASPTETGRTGGTETGPDNATSRNVEDRPAAGDANAQGGDTAQNDAASPAPQATAAPGSQATAAPAEQATPAPQATSRPTARPTQRPASTATPRPNPNSTQGANAGSDRGP